MLEVNDSMMQKISADSEKSSGLITPLNETVTGMYSMKPQHFNDELENNRKLIRLINEEIVRLFSIKPDEFRDLFAENVAKVAECMNVDCIDIHRATEYDGKEVYKMLYTWVSPRSSKSDPFVTAYGSDISPRYPKWDEKLLSKQGYLSELTSSFDGKLKETFDDCSVQAIMAFPVFFHGEYWGFVSYENRHSEKLCTEEEAIALNSASLLLANAIEVNERLLILNKRLEQQQLMSDISRSFITKDMLETTMQKALERIGAFLQADRAIIAIYERDSDISRMAYGWFAEDRFKPKTSSQKGFSSIIKEFFPQFRDKYEESLSIYCENAIKYDGGKFKLFYDRAGLKSFMCVPIYVEDELWGIMTIENHDYFRKWSQNDINLVTMSISAISNAVARDVMETERTLALEKAVKASQAKGNFLSTMSHEIRTPMNAIIGMTTIGKSANTIDKKDYAFDRIDNASRHLLGVINDILDISKIEANKFELAPTVFEFEKLLQKVVNVIAFRVEEQSQHLYINIDNNIPYSLIGDDHRINQVITNLLSNAVKFTPVGGNIHVNAGLVTGKDDKCVIEISVSDSGIGITPEQIARLFNAYEQAERETSRNYGGTGLGLQISKKIVEMMGGKIWVESEVDKGSIFTFTVELEKGMEERKSPRGADLRNVHMFAVSAEPEVCEFFMETSENIGISCDVVNSGKKAIDLIKLEDNYNICFVDWNLPDMTGLELAKRIRENSSGKEIIIMSSVSELAAFEDEAREIGLDKFLVKPLFRSSIVDAINQLLGVESAVEAASIQHSDTSYDFTGHTILVAEDVEINQEIVAALLEDSGIEIDFAENGLEAVKKFAASPDAYGMIFMDVQMPEMDGLEATRFIRKLKLPQASEIPIVAMTANVFAEDIEKCIDSGMNDHVGKPLNVEEVLVMLRKCLSEKQVDIDPAKVKVLE